MDHGYCVFETNDNGFLILGDYYWSDIWLLKTKSQGDTLWTKTIGNLGADGGYDIWLLGINNDGDYIIVGSTGRFDSMSIDVLIVKTSLNSTTINDSQNVRYPTTTKLYQNYPNPFNPETTIKYNFKKSEYTNLKIYNLFGQEMETLVNRFQTAGEYEIKRISKEIPSGIYFYRLQAGEFSETKKLILQK